MKATNYFKKNGYIYGASEKFNFGRLTGYAKKFDSMKKSQPFVGYRRGRL